MPNPFDQFDAPDTGNLLTIQPHPFDILNGLPVGNPFDRFDPPPPAPTTLSTDVWKQLVNPQPAPIRGPADVAQQANDIDNNYHAWISLANTPDQMQRVTSERTAKMVDLKSRANAAGLPFDDLPSDADALSQSVQDAKMSTADMAALTPQWTPPIINRWLAGTERGVANVAGGLANPDNMIWALLPGTLPAEVARPVVQSALAVNAAQGGIQAVKGAAQGDPEAATTGALTAMLSQLGGKKLAENPTPPNPEATNPGAMPAPTPAPTPVITPPVPGKIASATVSPGPNLPQPPPQLPQPPAGTAVSPKTIVPNPSGIGQKALTPPTGGANIGGAGTASGPIGTENFVNLASPERTAHILNGDATGGGHLWPGLPGKTPFPSGWNGNKVMHYVSSIATDPGLPWIQQTGKAGSLYTKAGDPARFIVVGEREGVKIKVVLEPAGEGVITAHPLP